MIGKRWLSFPTSIKSWENWSILLKSCNIIILKRFVTQWLQIFSPYLSFKLYNPVAWTLPPSSSKLGWPIILVFQRLSLFYHWHFCILGNFLVPGNRDSCWLLTSPTLNILSSPNSWVFGTRQIHRVIYVVDTTLDFSCMYSFMYWNHIGSQLRIYQLQKVKKISALWSLHFHCGKTENK